ncbi:MAG: hypothetical protein H8E15_09295 [Planctomycetes bacterium]|nr:hypothetical protein [Planctomycetota bacterium]
MLWQVGFALQDLHVGGVGSWANHVNNNGQIVGHWLDHTGRQFGFLWQAGSSVGLTGLPTHPNAIPRRINEFGFVVGTCLDALIPAHSGWGNWVATDINELGEISGTGFKNGLTADVLELDSPPTQRFTFSPKLNPVKLQR